MFYDNVGTTDAVARYLEDLYSKFGDWNLAISAYYCGPGRIEALIKKHKIRKCLKLRPYLPKEIQAYAYVSRYKLYFQFL